MTNEREMAEQRECVATFFREMNIALIKIETEEFAKPQTPLDARERTKLRCRQFIWRQIGVWTRHTERLHTWALADDTTPNPYKPPLTAWICAEVLLGLHGLLAPLREAA